MEISSPNSPHRPLRALIAEPKDFSNRALSILEEIAQVEFRAGSAPPLRQAFRDFDIVWVRLAQRIDAFTLGTDPRCRFLACATTGLDHIDMEACRKRKIEVISLKGETEFLREIRATAEHTLALALALIRRIPAAARSVESGTWNRDLFRGTELYGKTAGLVGLGRLGSIVATYLHALGMEVLGYDPRADFPMQVATPTASLVELLERSDLVSLHVSYDATTRGLLGPEELARIKPGAMLINTSRGGLIDEAALLQALESGHLGGAALDVLDSEPILDGHHPLIEATRHLPNLLIVPHIGGNTWESLHKTEIFIAEKIVRACAQERTP